MTKKIDAVREVASYWRKRYSAAQALIAELQRELDELAAGIKRRDAIIANLRTAAGGLPKSNTALPGSGLLGPYTPTADHFSLLVGKDKGGQWTAEMRDIPDTPAGIDPLGSWTGESWQLDDEDE